MGADAVDRAGGVVARHAAVGAHPHGIALALVVEHRAGLKEPALDDPAERHARRVAAGGRHARRFLAERTNRLNPLPRHRDIGIFLFDADEAAAQAFGHSPRGSTAEERIEDDLALVRCRENDPVQKRLGLLGRMGLLAIDLETLRAAADRDHPVRAHLKLVVQHLHGVVVEGVFLLGLMLGAPEKRLMGVGEPLAAEIRHRVRFAPDDVVQHPVADVLHRGADPEDVVIGADHPDRAGVLEDAARGGEPVAGEGVVGLEAVEPVPVVVDRIDQRIVRAEQLAAKLKVIGRVGEDEVDRIGRHRLHHLDAVALYHPIQRQRRPG